MSRTVIKVENLGKQYRLGQVGSRTLSNDLSSWWHRVRGNEDPNLKLGEVNDRTKKGESNLVWVLKNINFEVVQGEVMGIIGKNGAGKSTLLKILSKVTSPTLGSVKIKGRIASLLEVGTGFHPDLSGRENVFLNGAILGMSKQEIRNKFDEIVEFSGVDRYIDTPVKRYSSGMYVRLAFGVAAHLEPEILIVDEVLAVGDAEFQKKCLGKMKDVSEQGRTVLFVSHNIDAINSLCSRTICLKQGEIEFIGTTNEAVNKYLANDTVSLNINDFRIKSLKHLGKQVKIISIEKLSEDGFFVFGRPLRYRIKVVSTEHQNDLRVLFGIYSTRETIVALSYPELSFELRAGVVKTIEFSVNSNSNLTPDSYLTSIGIIQGNLLGKYQNMDIIMSYSAFDLLPPGGEDLNSNMMNWRKVWGNIALEGAITKIE